jgi:predicted dehydrogenase
MATVKNKIRWGIVGAGTIAHTFAADMAFVPNAEIIAVVARNQDSAEEFAKSYGIEKSFQGYDALYQDSDIDAVYIATPHSLHLQNSAAAMRAGKAVLCEKPITTSATECRMLMDIAAETDCYLMEAMWTWFLPAMRQARAWVDEGRIGELRHIKAELGFPKAYDPKSRLFDPLLAGGCLLDMGVYPIAIALYFTGSSPQEIQAVSRHAPNGVDDDVVMLFNYADCTANLATSFRCKLPNTAFVIGTDGYIVIPNAWRATQCHLYKSDEQIDSFFDKRVGSGFEFQIASVCEDIFRGHKQSGVVTHSASLALQQDMDRVRAVFGQSPS